MKEKQARKIIKSLPKKNSNGRRIIATGLSIRAEGYLEAMEKAKGLVEAIKQTLSLNHNPKRPLCDSCRVELTDVLAKWEKEK